MHRPARPRRFAALAAGPLLCAAASGGAALAQDAAIPVLAADEPAGAVVPLAGAGVGGGLAREAASPPPR